MAKECIKPELIEYFQKVSEKECFWFDLWSPYLPDSLKDYGHTRTLFIDMVGLKKVVSIFSGIVDNKSRFTEEHSLEVARIITKVVKREVKKKVLDGVVVKALKEIADEF